MQYNCQFLLIQKSTQLGTHLEHYISLRSFRLGRWTEQNFRQYQAMSEKTCFSIQGILKALSQVRIWIYTLFSVIYSRRDFEERKHLYEFFERRKLEGISSAHRHKTAHRLISSKSRIPCSIKQYLYFHPCEVKSPVVNKLRIWYRTFRVNRESGQQ